MQRRNTISWMIVIIFASVLIISQAVFAQDGDDVTTLLEERSVTILPLEEVTESAPEILDISHNGARLNFIGTIPLACTVVFGQTTEFGNISIDLNMDGAAIIDHNPLMLGLESDTEYFYRVQGSAEDGTIYIGEIGTFRTLPEPEGGSDNLLSADNGAEIVGVSSNFGDQENDGTWGIFNAFDGNPNTAWSTDGDGDEAWVEIQLAERSVITKVEFWTRFMTNGTAQIYEFTITTDSGEMFGPFELPDAEQSYEFDVEIEAETLRFDVVSSNGGNTGAVEIAVYGEPVDSEE